jgi:hypothetical protein
MTERRLISPFAIAAQVEDVNAVGESVYQQAAGSATRCYSRP